MTPEDRLAALERRVEAVEKVVGAAQQLVARKVARLLKIARLLGIMP